MMSAHRVFQCAFTHAQLLRPPDEELTYSVPDIMDMNEWIKLSPDCQAFIMTLGKYGMEENVGLFIYEAYPEIAAKIGPALRR